MPGQNEGRVPEVAYLIPVPKGDTGKGSPGQDLGFGVLRTPFHMGFVTPGNATCVNPLRISYVKVPRLRVLGRGDPSKV